MAASFMTWALVAVIISGIATVLFILVGLFRHERYFKSAATSGAVVVLSALALVVCEVLAHGK